MGRVRAARGLLLLVVAACGDGAGTGVLVRVQAESYGGNPNAVIASASTAAIDDAVSALSCSLSGGTCAVEFGPPTSPATIAFRLDVDPNSEQGFRSQVVWGGDCNATGAMAVLEPREYVCRAGLFTRQGLSTQQHREAAVRCTGAGATCAPRYELQVYKNTPEALPLSVIITTPSSQCSNLIFRIFRDDSLVVTSDPLAALQTTGAVFRDSVGTQFRLGLEAEVVPGGCQGSVLQEWHALLSLLG